MRDKLELMRAREDVYRPPQNQRLDLASADYALLAAAYELTQTVAEIRGCSPTYWRDTLAKIGFA